MLCLFVGALINELQLSYWNFFLNSIHYMIMIWTVACCGIMIIYFIFRNHNNSLFCMLIIIISIGLISSVFFYYFYLGNSAIQSVQYLNWYYNLLFISIIFKIIPPTIQQILLLDQYQHRYSKKDIDMLGFQWRLTIA